MKNTILEVRSLAKSFGKVKVFEDISFSLKKGSVMALIGASGSGKTTLLQMSELLGDSGTEGKYW
jgi:ABC-type Fe3+/spermidine/putrescine transport system ATPase subunit